MAAIHSILIADDEPSLRHVLTVFLTEHGYEVRAVANGLEAEHELSTRQFDILISDVRMPKMEGFALIDRALALVPDLTILMMSAYGSKEQAIEAVRRGAYDFLEKPFKPDEVLLLLQKIAERQQLVKENRRLKGIDRPEQALNRFVGASPAIESLKRQIAKVAPAPTSVLICGESGTGKELVARSLHELSPRAAMPFIAINCGAIPSGLIESELFGHAKGAFTDARSAKRGLFSEADGGTIFLDEIGELPMQAQVKLLRVLQDGEVRPVGELKVEKVNVRVVAATLRDLTALVAKGEFREDLYFRLNVVQLKVPPLRDRGDDVMLIARHLLNRMGRALNRSTLPISFAPEAEAALRGYLWPGNIRELENAIEHAVLLGEGEMVLPSHLPEKVRSKALDENAKRSAALHAGSIDGVDALNPRAGYFSLKRATDELEQRFIRAALRETRGNRTRAALLLELSQRALLYKLKEYGIDADAEGEKSAEPRPNPHTEKNQKSD